MQSLEYLAALWGQPALLDSEGVCGSERSGRTTTPLIP